MGFALIGKKVGMTRVFQDDGTIIPVTAIEIEPNVVTQLRTTETDGYTAVQVATGEIKPRNSTIPLMAHDAKAGTSPKRHHAEFRVSEDELGEYELGQELTVEKFADQMFVDVVGTSKGKGFAGGMKRHGFKGQLASHGVERKHRSPGSIGGHANNAGGTGGIKKGKKMAGQMGNERVTVRSLDVVRVDANNGLLLVKGPVPGANKGTVMVRTAVRIGRAKAGKLAEAGK